MVPPQFSTAPPAAIASTAPETSPPYRQLLEDLAANPTVICPGTGPSLPHLMATLAGLRGARLPQSPLAALSDLSADQHLILLVADGVGEAQIRRHLSGGLVDQHRRTTLQSVFPSTTATAVGTFMTGLSPARHALTGWTVWCREVAETLAVLPLARPGQPGPAPEAASWAQRIFHAAPLADQLQGPVIHLAPAWITDSLFNRHHGGRARCLPYPTLAAMFARLSQELVAAREPSLFYVYWPEFDTTAHIHGPEGEAAGTCLADFEAALSAFLGRHRGMAATLLVTADHGFISAPPERLIEFNQYPLLQSCLSSPLSGERRVAYARVPPQHREAFFQGVSAALGHALWIVPSTDLVAGGWFGAPMEAHPELSSRVGDFTLIMKEDWTLCDLPAGEAPYPLSGVHGGISTREMAVPLAVIPL